jgi:hypothetical protein
MSLMSDTKRPIRDDWENYYKTLEAIRRTGVVNMWGAAPVLRECYKYLTEDEANAILCSWIDNYDELNKKYGWQT